MIVKNVTFKENSVDSEVTGMKITFFTPFLIQPERTFLSFNFQSVRKIEAILSPFM